MKNLIIKKKLIALLIAFTLVFTVIGFAMFMGNKGNDNGVYITKGVYTAHAESVPTETGDKTLKEVKAQVSTNGKYLLLISAFDDSFLKSDGLYYIGYKYTFNNVEIDTTQLEGAKTSTYYGAVAINTDGGVERLEAKDIYSNEDFANYGLIVYEIEFETTFEEEKAGLENIRSFITEVVENGEGYDVVEELQSGQSQPPTAS